MYIIILVLKAPVSGDKQLGYPLHLLYHKVVLCCVIVDKAQGVDECTGKCTLRLLLLLRLVFQVIGSSGTPYICFNSSHYCSCPAFTFTGQSG